MLIDTHCHLDFEAYAADLDAVMTRAAENGITRVITPAINIESGAAAIALAEKYQGVYAAVGFHPNDTADFSRERLPSLKAQTEHPKVVAVGEIGLDYYRDWSPRAKQHEAFEAQLALAAEAGLPVIIHNREASEDVLAVLANWVPTLPDSLRERPGVLHSFSAPRAAAEKALSLGFYLGFTGPITFKNAHDLRIVAAVVPLDRLLIETDGPFLTPHPYRGQRNEPAYVRFVAERLAELRNTTLADMARITTTNAERLFNLSR